MDLQKRYGGEYVATYKGRVVVHAKKAGIFVKKLMKHPQRRSHLTIQFFSPYRAVCIYGISSLRKTN